jgi:hypothetical protein
VWILFKEAENTIANIRLGTPSGPLIVCDILLPGAKSSRPFLQGSETERVLSVTFRKFTSDLLIPFLTENKLSNRWPLLHQERHSENDESPEL